MSSLHEDQKILDQKILDQEVLTLEKFDKLKNDYFIVKIAGKGNIEREDVNLNKIDKPLPSSLKKCMTRKIYKQKDFTEESCKKLYSNLSRGLLSYYLKNKKELDNSVPIQIQNISF